MSDYTEQLNELDALFNAEYVDDSEPIQVVGRDIMMPSDEVYMVCCDSNSQILTFQINRYVEGIDLSTKVASIKFKNARGGCDRAVPHTLLVDTDNIILTWLVDKRATIAEGDVAFQIEFYEVSSDNVLYSWQTKMQTFKVLKGLDADGNLEPPTPSWVQAVDAAIRALQSDMLNKVDKVSGKDLSTNDFTNYYKTKLANAASTTYVDTQYAELKKLINQGGGGGSYCGIEYCELELAYIDVDYNYCLPLARNLYSYSNGVYLLKWDYGDNPRYGFFIKDDWNGTIQAHLYCDGQVYYCDEAFFDGFEEWSFGDWQKITYSKNEIDIKFGDVDSALDELHNYAQALIGGDA